MEVVYFLLAAIVGYLFGAIPFGWIFVRLAKGKDLRDIQSGRTGGTNAMRAAGPIVGGLTALGDVLKGAAAIWLARFLFSNLLATELLPWAEITVGVMSIIGHNWSVFLGWRGGAGTGPNVGWATAVWWPVFPIAMVVVLGVLLLTGMASLASLAMGLIIVVVFAALYVGGVIATPAYLVGSLLTLAVVTWALRPNIHRILKGEERVVGPAARRREKMKARRTEG